MSGPFGSSQWMYSSGGGFYPHTIDQSLRFNDNDSAYLSRTPASTTNRKTWTYSVWVKVAKQDSYGMLLECNDGSGNNEVVMGIDGLNKLVFYSYIGGYQLSLLSSANLIRDPSAWYHFVFVADTTQATASERARVYINGIRLTSFSTETYPSQNYDTYMNLTQLHTIGRMRNIGRYFDGYMAEANLIDGQALDPTSFGEFKSGVWVAKDYSGSYGTNGFHLEFANSGSLGADTSGNSNNWTANNLAATDQVLDSPTNNFATMNSVDIYDAGCNLEEGNLKVVNNATTWAVRATFAANSGKWYWEQTGTNQTNGSVGGRAGGFTTVQSTAAEQDVFGMFWHPNTGINTIINGSFTQRLTGTNYGDNDIIAQALDLDNNVARWYKNGTLVYTYDFSSHVPVGSEYFAPYSFNGSTGTPTNYFNFGQDSSFAGNKTAQGNTDDNGVGDFYHPVPSGYLALCSANLPEPAISPANDDSPSDYFNTVLFNGNGGSNAITGVGFQPDFVWVKSRSNAFGHNLHDAIRGTSSYLESHSTDAENTLYTDVCVFDADGFTLSSASSANNSGTTSVGWSWLAGNGTSSNTDGSITSTVSVNQTAGFSIVSWTGTGSSSTVGHGLSSTPELIINKNRSASENWVVYSIAQPNGSQYLRLNSTNSLVSDSSVFGAAPTSSVFTVGTNPEGNGNGNNHIAYCFHSVEGYSKIGIYTGNGSSDGPFVYTGFRPAWLMVKRKSGSSDWVILDTTRDEYNIMLRRLDANTNASENTAASYLDAVSNGFKIKTTNGNYNASGHEYIYMAFAENPFKYANAR